MTENVLLKAFSNFEVFPMVKKLDHPSVLKKATDRTYNINQNTISISKHILTSTTDKHLQTI